MKEKDRIYDFGVNKQEVANCNDFKTYIKTYGDKVRRFEEFGPCGIELSLQLKSCGPLSYEKFKKKTLSIFPDVTFTPPRRNRN